MPKLSEPEIERSLSGLSGWTRSGDSLVRAFALPSFPAALVFASAVGHLAERADHHPDILIQYNKVTLKLSTHSAGGLTDKDFELAQEINGIARESQPG
jgi:4a-hydroxytetrahydrobiopterin dehydratase